MRTSLLLILGLLFLLPTSALAGTCAIEQGPPAKVVEYLKQVDTELSAIESAASSASTCKGEDGSFTNERRFADLINEIDAQNPVFPDLATDFQYRIMLVVSGDARSPVMRQGEVWRTTETKIISTMKAVATKCALDTSYTSGTLKSVLKGMLIRNKTLESYFKQVATGNPIAPEGTSVEPSLFTAIKLNYSPEMTLGCKNDAGLAKLAEKSAELLKWITDTGKKTEGMNDNWKIALSIFRGTISNTEYQKIHDRVLREELVRQGLNSDQIARIMGASACVSAAENDGRESWLEARVRCAMKTAIGGNVRVDDIFKTFTNPKTSDAYLQRQLDYDTAKYKASREMPNFWTSIESKTKDLAEDTLNDKVLTDLINIHVRLSETNTLLEKKIPEMQANCMKGQPDIVGGCRSAR